MTRQSGDFRAVATFGSEKDRNLRIVHSADGQSARAIEKSIEETLRKMRESSTPGLTWGDFGADRPILGTELFNFELKRSLERGQVNFSQATLVKFGLQNLTFDDFILVEVPVKEPTPEAWPRKTYFRPRHKLTADQRVADFVRLRSVQANLQRARTLAENGDAAASRVFGSVGLYPNGMFCGGGVEQDVVDVEQLENDVATSFYVEQLENDVATSMHALTGPNKSGGRQQDEQIRIQEKLKRRSRSREEEDRKNSPKEATTAATQAVIHLRDQAAHVQRGRQRQSMQDLIELEQTRIKGMLSPRHAHTPPRKSSSPRKSRSPSKCRNAAHFFPAQLPGDRDELISGGFEMLQQRRRGPGTPGTTRFPGRSFGKSQNEGLLGLEGTGFVVEKGAVDACGRGGDFGELGLDSREHQRLPARVVNAQPRADALVVLHFTDYVIIESDSQFTVTFQPRAWSLGDLAAGRFLF
jgi:hypothetical protein